MRKLREWMVGRRGEVPLVPPYIPPSFKKALALGGVPVLISMTDTIWLT